MDSEIQFGDFQEAEPTACLRPDQNKHLAVVACGNVDPDDLPVFVDLDVMREMESHARTNTSVELGGVMLGQQCTDDQGRSFVVVNDSLRAEHYEATKGSFKFTHDTWEAITREKDEFPDGLQMVGWYHTHPDWGVFLSGMDIFICENFFNRPLDVALVIDPCRDDRGWFQWTGNRDEPIRRTRGFYLTTNRFRQQELEQFVYSISENNEMAHDPRFSNAPGNQPIVHFHQQQAPTQHLMVIGVLALQAILIGLIAYKVLMPMGTDDPQFQAQVDVFEKKLDQLIDSRSQQAQQEAVNQVLETIVSGQTGGQGFVDQIADLNQQNALMQSNLNGQRALADESIRQRDQAQNNLDQETKRSKKLAADLEESKSNVARMTQKLEEIESPSFFGGQNLLMLASLILIAVALVAGGVYFGYTMRRDDYDAGEPPPNREPEFRADSFTIGDTAEANADADAGADADADKGNEVTN